MYLPIDDYGIVGDTRSIALVSREGSVDYCSLPDLDSPTLFAALLDDQRGGYFRVRPSGKFQAEQRYLKDTNILIHDLRTGEGEAELLVFMPAGLEGGEGKDIRGIHTCLRLRRGKMDFSVEFRPRPGYARDRPELDRNGDLFTVAARSGSFTFRVQAESYELKEISPRGLELDLSLEEGQSAHFDIAAGEISADSLPPCSLETTRRFWVDWLDSSLVRRVKPPPELEGMINRSLLTLKLLIYAPTGAVAAAATTSLPEAIGGERNWDYRFSWIRDASFTLKALFNYGYIGEARAYVRWLQRTYKRSGSRNLRIMYSLRGGDRLEERELEYLDGYRGSRPVRIGNSAYRQNQWDVYGEIMDAALVLSDYAGKVDESLWPFFVDICNQAAVKWKDPDEGIWEVRNGPFHFVYSKAMCWAALDRGLKIARRYGFDAPAGEWESAKKRIAEELFRRGYSRRRETFVQRYDSEELDAVLLLLAQTGMVGGDDRRFRTTVAAVRRELMEDGYLLRYRAADGMEGREGAFLLCNFWLVEALAGTGDREGAVELLRKTVGAANHLWLFAEEYDYREGTLLGNFPQAFSHIGFLNAVHRLYRSAAAGSETRPLRIRLKGFFRRKIPYRVTLNRGKSGPAAGGKEIARQLKIKLGLLQGAFFDVEEGRVDYRAMKESEQFADYRRLARTLDGFPISGLEGEEEKTAFWINIYNILIIHGVIYFEPENSVREVTRFFRRLGYRIGGMFFAPDDIEHGILRGNRPHPFSGRRVLTRSGRRAALAVRDPDPRVHFALVCASSSCPPIEFYDGESLDRQLDLAARSFIRRRGLVIEREKETVHLSPIFKWYRPDFGGKEEDVFRFLEPYLEEEQREFIRRRDGLKVRYLPYNWNLNSRLK